MLGVSGGRIFSTLELAKFAGGENGFCGLLSDSSLAAFHKLQQVLNLGKIRELLLGSCDGIGDGEPVSK